MPPVAPAGESPEPERAGSGGRGPFTGGFLVAALPLALLLLPLLFHHSEHPVVASFGRGYLIFLSVASLLAAATALLVGWACRRAASRAPAFAFVLGVVAVVATCGFLEMALTYRLRSEDAFAEYAAWGHKRSLLFAFEAAPNNRWTNGGATYTTDRLGFRTHLRGPWDAQSGMRIFAIGESSVFGYGLNDDETWPHLLEAKLRARLGDDTATVVNAGNNGFTSLQTLFRFYTKVVPQKPTHVILYLGPNDVYGTGPDHLLISEEILFGGSVAQFWAAKTQGKNLYSRTLLYYLLQRAVPALAPHSPKGKTAADAPRWDAERELDAIGRRYIENVRTICLIARAHGIEPVLVTFMHDLPAAVPFPPRSIRNTNALLRTFAAAERVELIDMEETLRPLPGKEGYFFPDHYHPSRQGAELIASTIAAAWH